MSDGGVPVPKKIEGLVKKFEKPPDTSLPPKPPPVVNKLDPSKKSLFQNPSPQLPPPPIKKLTIEELVAKEQQLNSNTNPSTKSTEVIAPCPHKHPEISVTTPVDYQLQPLKAYAGGKPAVEQIVTVQNTGTADLTVSAITLDGAHKADFTKTDDDVTGKTMTPGESRTFKITFEPSEVGARVAWFRVTSNARTEPQVNRDLTGRGGVPQMTVTPPTLDFAVLHLTKKAAAITVTIESTGDVDLTLSSLSIADAVEGQYTAVLPGGWNTPLAPGAKVLLPVEFEAKKEGLHVGKVSVKSNAQTTPSADVELKAKVIDLKNPQNPEFIASGHELVKLKYDVFDSGTAISRGKFEIFDKKNALVFTRVLTAAEYRHGNVEMDFEGKITPSTAGYPDDCLTVEHSPYKWKVTVEADGCPDPLSVEKAIKVEVHSIELELGEKAALVKARHQTAFDTLSGALPAKGSKTKLKLSSNFFKTSLPERLHNDLADFNQFDDMGNTYENTWGEGPLVPIYAKIWVKDSGGVKKEAPKALGEVPVMWDYKEAAKDLSGLHPQAQEYVKNAHDYHKASTEPKGDNCATHFGGKRGNPSTEMFLTAHAGAEVTAFPFAAGAAGGTRTWAVYTKPLRAGTYASKTGVMFRPSRLAGDSYVVHAYVDIDKAQDKVADPPDQLHDWTGTFEIWRQVDIIKVYRKAAAVAVYNHDEVKLQYEKAFMELRDLSGGAALMLNHNAKFEAAINRQRTQSTKDLMLADYAVVNKANNLGDGTNAAITMKEYDTFYNAYLDAKSTPAEILNLRGANAVWVASIMGPPDNWTDIQVDNELRTFARNEAKNELQTEGLWHATPATRVSQYKTACAKFTQTTAMRACNESLNDAAVDGIAIFHFEWTDNFGGSIAGVALNTSNHSGTNRMTRNKTGYVQAAPPSYYTGQKSMDQTVAHELGHCMFLPHTQYEVGNVEDADAHDLSDDRCLMSYNFDRQRRFCGFCLLRLRGWRHDDTRLVSAGTNARKPKLSVTLDPASFAAVEASKTWVDAKILIVNSHDQPLTISDIVPGGANAGDYTINGIGGAKKEHAAGATIELTMVFAPPAGGERVVTLTITSNHPAHASQVITIKSDGTKFNVTAAAGPFAGSAPVVSVTKVLEVKNTGNAPLSLTGFSFSGTDPGSFEIVDAGTSLHTLAPNATGDLKVKMTPSGPSAKKATLAIASTDAESPKNVALHGLGSLPAITVTPSPLAFGDINQPKEKKLNLTLTNTSTEPLSVSSIVLEGPNCADITVGAGAPCEIAAAANQVIEITYRGSAKGNKTAKLRVLSNAPTSPDVVDVTAKVTMAELSFTSTADFGNVSTNYAPEARELNLVFKNTGDGPLDITGAVTLAGDVADWEVTTMPGAYPHTLAANASYTAKLKFKPQTTGNKQVVLTPATDAPGNVVTFTAKGNGAGVPIVQVSQVAPVAFGNMVNGTKSGVTTVTITNSGTGPMNVTGVASNAPDFAIENQVGANPVPAGGSMTFDVYFQPGSAGAKNGTITVSSDGKGGAKSFAVSGTGVNP